jgi:hypothetical protein
MAKEVSIKDKDRSYSMVAVVDNGHVPVGQTMFCNGNAEGNERIKFGDFTDDCFDGDIVTGDDAIELYDRVNHEYGVGAIYLQKIGGDYSVPFAIKLSPVGLDKCNDIKNKARTRQRNKYEEPLRKDMTTRLADFNEEKRFNDGKKKANVLGLSLDEYFSVLLFLDRIWPHEFLDAPYKFLKILDKHKVNIKQESARKALLKLLCGNDAPRS